MRLKLHDNLGCHSWDSEPVSDLRAFQLIISPAHHLTVQMETLKLGWGEGGAGRHIDGLVGRVGHFVSDSASVHRISPARILEWVVIFLLQGIFPAQGSNPPLLRWQADSLLLSHQGGPISIACISLMLCGSLDGRGV